MLDQIIEFLKKTDELEAANSLLNTVSKYAIRAEEYDNLARWYMEIKNYPSAIKFAEKALINTPSNEGMYACRSNLAKLYNHMNDPKSSLRYSTTNLRQNPEDLDALLEQVFSYFLLNEKPKSEAILREVITRPDLPENVIDRVKFNLGTYDLYNGDFKKGLRGFLLEGKKLGIWKNATLPFKFWDGGIQPDKTLIIYAEGGIGDEIINVRFMKHLKELGMIPLWFTTRKDLTEVFNRNGFETISDLKSCPKDSLWTYSMSLPVFLDLEPKDLWDGPYLTANPEYIGKWADEFDKSTVNVGIRWTGNPAYEHDLHRSVPLYELYDTILDYCDNVYSLQRDDGADEIYTDAIYTEIKDLQYELKTIEDTLAVMYHLDLIVTSCTSIAHMAAALGKKVFILVPITAYYTWASTHDTSSIWYGDNVKVFRQTVHKSWKEPLEQLKFELELIKFGGL